MNKLNKLINNWQPGNRIAQTQAALLYDQAPLHLLGSIARSEREFLHPDSIVTYVLDRNINYTNICVCCCKFCAFYRTPEQAEGYVLSKEELSQKIEQTIALGGTQILLQGSHNPKLDLDFYLNMLKFIKKNYPQIHIHAFSPPEIFFIASLNNISTKELLEEFVQAGLNSIPGGGAEILVDSVRNQVSPNKCSAEAWLRVMQEAHEMGLKTTATMMFGHVETKKERIEHLFKIRSLQDRTKGFTAFIPWTFQPMNTALPLPKSTSIEYLRLLALSRIVLDNFDNLQVSWVTMGSKIAQLGLFYGANDFGSTMLEENVVAASGVKFRLNIEQIQETIAAAGFIPRQRRMDYTLI